MLTHGVEISNSQAVECAMHHFVQYIPIVGQTDLQKITLATDSRTTISIEVNEKLYSKMTFQAKKMRLPTSNLILLAVMLVSEGYEEATEGQVTLIKERFKL